MCSHTNQAYLHLIVPNANVPEERDHKIFPDKDEAGTVTSIALTTDFLIYSTSRGTLHHFYLADWGVANEYKYALFTPCCGCCSWLMPQFAVRV